MTCWEWQQWVVYREKVIVPRDQRDTASLGVQCQLDGFIVRCHKARLAVSSPALYHHLSLCEHQLSTDVHLILIQRVSFSEHKSPDRVLEDLKVRLIMFAFSR